MKRVVLKNTALIVIITATIFSSASVFADASEDASMTFTVNVPVFLTTTVNNIALNANNNLFTSGIMNFSATTNNQTGYTTTITTNKNTEENYSTDLKHTAADIFVPSLTTSVLKANFPTNYWGFSLDDNTYMGLPAKNQTPLAVSSSTAPAIDSKDIYFGAKVDGTKASGTYTNEVLITTVVNYVPEWRTLADITYMQEVTNDICGNTPTPLASDGADTPQYQLIDNRDNKKYWVAKLADGKCWMTQNLDLNLDSSVTLTNENTDLNSVASWTPVRSTIDVSSNMTTTNTAGSITGWGNDNNAPYSVDVGNVYFDGVYSSSSNCNYLTTDCDHFKNTAQTLNGGHGHVGNYYSWSAAVASNNTTSFTTSGADYPDSICPKGWRLSSTRSSSIDDDFVGLRDIYNATYSTNDNIYISAPIFFVRSGGIFPSLGNTNEGNYWSSVVDSASGAFVQLFRYDFVASMNSARYFGYPVRCIVGDSKTYTINYDKNTTDIVSDFPENVTSKTHSNAVLISPNTPTRSGYQFMGWATTSGGTAAYQPGALVNVSSGPVTLYAVWQELHTFTLNYNANGGTGAPSAQTETTVDTSATFTISSTIPTMDGYDFLGWNTSSTATTPSYTYTSGSFSPSTINVTSTETLYAVWEEVSICNPSATTISEAICMQDMNQSIIDSMVTEQQYQLIDSRDEKTYFIAKLQDGKVWMTQNLDLNLDVNTKLTPENTDLNSAEAIANGGWTPTRSTIDVTFNKTTTGTSATITGWTDDYYTPYSLDPGNVYFDGVYFNSSTCNYLTKNCTHFKNTKQTLNNEHGHIGNYYNWSAVVASNNTASYKTGGVDYPDSICPKGWRLPHGSASGNDFATLNTAYGVVTNSDQTLLSTPLFFVRAGGVWSRIALDGAADYGRYWSSTVTSSGNANYLSFNSSGVDPYGGGRDGGFSARCVARTEPLLGAANGYTDPQGKVAVVEKDYTGTMIASMLLWPIAALSAGGVAVIIYKRGTGE